MKYANWLIKIAVCCFAFVLAGGLSAQEQSTAPLEFPVLPPVQTETDSDSSWKSPADSSQNPIESFETAPVIDSSALPEQVILPETESIMEKKTAETNTSLVPESPAAVPESSTEIPNPAPADQSAEQVPPMGPSHPQPGPPPMPPQGQKPEPVVVVVPQENTTAAAAPVPAASTDPATAQLAAHLRTPRLTFEYFLNLSDYNRYAEASKALDFSDMPDISEKQKKELAYDLYMVLYRLSTPDLESIPTDEKLKEYVYQPNKDFDPLYLINKGGMFFFSPETVGKISDMYKMMQDIRPKILDEIWPFCAMSDWWFKTVLGLRRIQWAALGIVLILGYFIGWLVSKILYYLTITTFHIMSSDLSEYKISKQTWRPIGWLLMYILWFVGIMAIQVPPKVVDLMRLPLHALAVLMIVISGLRLINILALWGRKKVSGTKSKLDEILIPLLTRSLKILIIVIGVGMILQALGFSAVGIVSGMGIGGIAIALAAQNTIANLFGSITVMIDRPFVIGDWIVTGDFEGTVEAVGLRSTRIRTLYDSLVTVPNNVLTTAVIDNMGRRHFRRYKTMLGVQYDTPPDRIEAFCEGIRELILSYNFTRKDVFHVYANEFSASSIDILLICFFLVPDTSAERKARSIFILDILRLAEKMDIRFAFPSQTIYNIPVEDKGYDDPLVSSDEFGRASAAGIIERRVATERARRSAAAHGAHQEQENTVTNSAPEDATLAFTKQAENLRNKRRFFRNAG